VLPISLIRENPDFVKSCASNKNEKIDIDKILELDKIQRSILSKLNDKRAQRNSASEKIGLAKRMQVKL